MEEINNTIVLWGNSSPLITPQMKERSRNDQRNKEGYFLYNLPSKIILKKIVTATHSACILSNTGHLYSWGSDSGHGTNIPTNPLRLEILSSYQVTSLAAGSAHYLCSTEDGKIFSWGQGTACLGHGVGINNLPFPTCIESLHGELVVEVAATSLNSFAITSNKCYSWGDLGSLVGNGSSDATKFFVPQCLNLRGEMKKIFAGVSHVGLLLDEKVYMWGSNRKKECCHLTDQDIITIPKEIEPLSDGRSIQSLALGNEFTLALSSDGKVYGWGANEVGQLGSGFTRQFSNRVQISALSSREIIEIYAGQKSCGCKTKENEYFSWGENSHGQLGHGDVQNWTIPRLLNLSLLFDNYNHMRAKKFYLSLYTTFSLMSFETEETIHLDFLTRLYSDIASQFDQETICNDVTIIAQERKIFASTFILCSRSKYFHALFSANMSESLINTINIEDFSYEAVHEMIRFLYTGRCILHSGNAIEILKIGKKYCLEDLSNFAESFLSDGLSFENVFEIFVQADHLDALHIREKTKRYILSHWSMLAKSTQITTLPSNLLLELIQLSANLTIENSETSST